MEDQMLSDGVVPQVGIEAPNSDGDLSDAIEEMFELQHGKNPDGTAITKKVSKADLLSLAQKGFGANQSFEEAKALKSQMTELARLMADPEKVFEVLSSLGHDTDKLMMGRFHKQSIENMKSPEEKEFEVLKRDAELYRKQQAEHLQQQKEAQVLQLTQQYQNVLMDKIEQVLSASGVDKTKQTVAEIARCIKIVQDKEGDKFRLENVPVEQLVKHLQRKRQTSFTSLIDELDDDGILQMLTPAQRQKIGAALTKQLQGQGMQPVRQPQRIQQEQKPAKRKFISMDESRGGSNRFK